MSDLWVVVPAAGQSRRFREAGYHTPKPLLRIENTDGLTASMIMHVLSSLPPTGDKTRDERILVGLPEDVDILVPFYPYRLIPKTLGQADTVYQLIQELPGEDSVLVLDCDMILDPLDIEALMHAVELYDVAIAVTTSFDPNASRVDQVPFPTRFVEKEPISQYAIVGARAFKSIDLLRKALKRTIDRYKSLGQEPYLSVVINHYPGVKYTHQITKYTDWGTPQAILESGARIIG